MTPSRDGKTLPHTQEPGEEGGAWGGGWSLRRRRVEPEGGPAAAMWLPSIPGPSTEELHGHCLADELLGRDIFKPGL